MQQRPARSWGAAIAIGALAAVLLAGCGLGTSAVPAGSRSDGASAAVSSNPASSTGGVASPAGANAGSTGIGGDQFVVACESLIAIDAVPVPDTEADAAAYQEFGQAVRPHLAAAQAAAPADLAAHLAALQPIVDAAADLGQPPSADDPVLETAVAAYEAWAHAHCGYQNVDLMAMDYEFDGLPSSLAAGPTSFSLMNHSEKGEFHVAVLARERPGSQIGLKQLADVPFESIAQFVDLVPGSAAAPPGAISGLLTSLTTGHYFLLCPSQSEENDPLSAHMFKGMLAEFDVE